jgi:hypothetical protein
VIRDLARYCVLCVMLSATSVVTVGAILYFSPMVMCSVGR